MTTSLIQPSFAKGEIAPELYARTDLAAYQTGLRTCENFFVLPYGGISNRPGTRFIAQTKNNNIARMIRFKFSETDTYALEFTGGFMRVYRNGGLVLSGPSTPFELAIPFTQDELFDIRYTQSADTMILVHPNHKPQKLTRLGHASWTIADISLVPSISAPASATATTGAGSGTSQTWRYQVTAVLDDGTQTIEESLPVTSNALTVFSSDLRATVTWPAVAGATYYNIYKDNAGAGIYGFIGRASATNFTDVNIAPTKTDTPPTGADPFVGAGNYPSAVGFYQQRLVFACTNNKPQTLWFSKSGVFYNFGYSTPIKDDDSIVWTIASTQVNRIQHLTPLRALLTFTDGAEFVIQGTSAGFTPKTISGDAVTYNGSSKIRPIIINNAVIYAQERGKTITAFGYSLDSDGFSGSDVSILSPHLLQSYGLVDWDYQKIPNSIIWGVREDGAMLGLTYMAEQQVVAWHRHSTDGLYKSVASVPEGREDYLYLCVERTINGAVKRYVERMETRLTVRVFGQPDPRYAFFVDSGLTASGDNLGSTTITLSGGTTWEYPESLTATASAASFQAGDVGAQIQYRGPTLEMTRLQIIGFTSSTVVTVRPLGVVPVESRNVASNIWAIARSTYSGLAHLEGKLVSILADGNVEPQQVVTSGQITLTAPAAVVTVGLPYESVAETLEITIAGQETLFDKHKIVKGVMALVNETRGGFYGPSNDDDKLYEIKQRDISDDYGNIPLLSGKESIPLQDTWQGNGRVVVVQKDPLPITVLALIPQMNVGGNA